MLTVWNYFQYPTSNDAQLTSAYFNALCNDHLLDEEQLLAPHVDLDAGSIEKNAVGCLQDPVEILQTLLRGNLRYHANSSSTFTNYRGLKSLLRGLLR